MYTTDDDEDKKERESGVRATDLSSLSLCERELHFKYLFAIKREHSDASEGGAGRCFYTMCASET